MRSIPWRCQPPVGTPLAGLVRAVKSYDGLWLPGQSSQNLLIGSASSYSAAPQRQVVGGQWGLNTAGSNGYVSGANQDAIAYTGLTYIATFRPTAASVTSTQSAILHSSGRTALYWDQQTSAYQQTLFIIGNAGAFPLSYGSPAVGAWTTVVAVADMKGNGWIYRDGKLVASSSSYATSCTSNGSGTPVVLGNDGSNFPGEIALGASLGYAIPLPLALSLSANPWQLFSSSRVPRFYPAATGPTQITISPTTAPAGMVGVAYSQQYSAAGGVSPYEFSVSAGSLPPGLTFSSAGLLSGTPTTAGSYSFTLEATDADGHIGTQPCTTGMTRYVSPPGLMYVILSNVKPNARSRIRGLANGNLLELSGNSTGTAPVPGGVGVNSDGTYVFGPGYRGGAVWARMHNQATGQWGAWTW